MYRRLIIFIVSASLAIAFRLPAQSQEISGLQLAVQAQQLYQAGRLIQAATTWQNSAAVYEESGDRLGRTTSLIDQAQALQNLGLYPRACKTLLEAFEIKYPDCNGERIDKLIDNVTVSAKSRLTSTQGIGLRSLGSVLQHKGMLTRSQKLLKLSQAASSNPAELGATLLALGNVEAALGNQTRDRQSYDKMTEIIDRQDPNLALKPYLESFQAYEQAASNQRTLPITQVQAQLNHLSLLIKIENWWQQQTNRRLRSWQRLDQTELVKAANNFTALLNQKLDPAKNTLVAAIDASWRQLPPTRQGIYALINYSKSLSQLGYTAKIETILQTALQQAQTIQDTRSESYALGYLAQYYGQKGQTNKAIALTNQALILAQTQNVNGDAREVMYLWQSQLGKLLKQEGKTAEATEAYISAFNTLQSLRTDLNANNQLVQFDFLQEVKPVYLSLANLLLQTDSNNNMARAKSLTAINVTNAKNDPDPNLELARQVIESLQLAELDNFFQDPCSQTADATVTIDELDSQAAVIYPIVLSDRLEVILSIAGQPLQKFTTSIPEASVNQTLDLLYDSLYNQSVDNSAVNIFSTTPINPQELTENTLTLLPTLEKVYSWLIEPLTTELEAKQIKTLVFVLNGRLQNVPMAALYDGKQYLLENYAVALAPGLQLLDTQSKPKKQIKVLAAGLSQQVEIKGDIFPALSNVPRELNQIESVFPQSRQLLNQEFTQARIEKLLQNGFPIVHLATHGVFSSDPNQTFIVTGDRHLIGINTLSKLLTADGTKPELLVLSACDTATGDERAVLGFAGVAVRSGTTTLASLWSVEDASTSQLMSQFYREFKRSTVNKADALQKAQVSLIESLKANPLNPELKQLPPHPYYWAAYVLVGNWQ